MDSVLRLAVPDAAWFINALPLPGGSQVRPGLPSSSLLLPASSSLFILLVFILFLSGGERYEGDRAAVESCIHLSLSLPILSSLSLSLSLSPS